MLKKILIIYLFICGVNLLAQNGILKTYYSSGKISSRLSFAKDVLVGKSFWYFKNGNLKEEKDYSNGRLNGISRTYYENGLIRSEFRYNMGVLDGVQKYYYSNGGLDYIRNYTFGKLISEKIFEYDTLYIAPLSAYKEGQVKKTLDNTDFICSIDVCPEPIGGIEEIQSNLIYPKLAKQFQLEGSVLIRVNVLRNGNIGDIEILKGLGLGCDEAAINAVKKTKFVPGMQNGKPVNADVTFTIFFNLKENTLQKSVVKNSKKAENINDNSDESYIKCSLEKCPKPIGGITELLSNLRYPPQAKRNKIEGEVQIKVSINEFGFVVGAEVLKGIGYGCDEAAKSLLLKTQFIPAKEDGKEIPSEAEITIPFILHSNKNYR